VGKIDQIEQILKGVDYKVEVGFKNPVAEVYNDLGGFNLSYPDGFPLSIVLSSKVSIENGKRGFGFGKKQHQDRLKIAKNFGFKTIFACVRKDNKREIHILHLFG
jgi:hypothetical protein